MGANFNALNGPELKKYILSQIETHLDSTGEFLSNITFPWIKFDYEVKVLVYPKQAMTDDPKLVVRGEGQVIDILATFDPTLPGDVKVDLKSSEVIDTPDQARVDSGQPIPTTAPGTKGVLVDKPIDVKIPNKGKHA